MKSMNPALVAAALVAAAVPASAQNAAISLTSGADGYVSVPYSPALVPTSGITVEAWIKYDDSTLPAGWNWPTICRQGLQAGEESYFLRVEAANTNTTSIRWFVATTAGGINVNWAFTPGQLNTWTHIAASYDGKLARLFINGAEVASAAGNGQPLADFYDPTRPSDFDLNIGRGSPVGNIEVFNGSIDEFRFWPYARTANEIAQAMSLSLLMCPGGVSVWNLDNNYLDNSSGRNGTGVGAISFVPGPSSLTLGVLGAFNTGASTAGCKGPIRLGVSSQFAVGNNDFALVGYSIPANKQTIALLSPAVLTTPTKLLGFDLWVDPTAAVVLPVPSAGLATVRLPLPLPVGVPVGANVATQLFSIDSCGPQGITASEALGMTTL